MTLCNHRKLRGHFGRQLRLLDDLETLALERIKAYSAAAIAMDARGFYVAFSGGKDSVVLLDLVKRSGVPYTAHYHLTTVDPPELVNFIRSSYPDVEVHRPALTMWQLIKKRKMPPRRNARFCCEVLKEGGGVGRVVTTGVRWAESSRRSKRQMTEPCLRNRRKRYFHPIIDWKDTDVWGYIHERGLAYCRLYDEGFKRVGCVLCPMTHKTARDLARWPKLCKAWERAVKATFKPGGDKKHVFKDAESYWQWWLDRRTPAFNGDEESLFT